MFKRLQEIRKRKEEIRKALLGKDEVDLQALKDELAGLEGEETELRSRAELAKSLNSGEIEGNEIEKSESRANNSPFETATEKDFSSMPVDEVAATPEFRSAFLKQLQGKKLSEVEERAMLSTANNAAVVPTQTLNKIVEKLKQVSVIFPLVTQLNIPSNVSIPVENANTDANWVAEITASTDGADLTTSPVALGAYKLIKTLEISANVAAMSIDAFEGFIVNQLSNKCKMAIDAAIISGDGTTQAQGIVTAIGSGSSKIETAASTGWTYTDVLNLLKGLSSMYATNAVMVMSRNTLYSRIASILDDNKRPIFIQNAENGFVGKVMGVPVITYDAMGDDKIIFGDFSYYYFNFVQNFAIEQDKSVGFRTGSTVYRAMALCDGKVTLTEAFVYQTKKS